MDCALQSGGDQVSISTATSLLRIGTTAGLGQKPLF
jgi:hypothetical protein